MCNTILVVDDEKSMRRLLTAILVEYGFGVDAAANTREADQLLATNVYDAIVVDYHMPDEDGIQWLTRRQAGEFPMPCILISGGAEETLRHAARHIRVAAIMCKPFDLSAFVELVRQHTLTSRCREHA
jgi:two-component system, chemotaxis family, chemotaxis protein CheY